MKCLKEIKAQMVSRYKILFRKYHEKQDEYIVGFVFGYREAMKEAGITEEEIKKIESVITFNWVMRKENLKQ